MIGASEAVQLSAEYCYYRIFHPNLLAATREAILKLDTPLSCVTQDERDKAEAKLAKLKVGLATPGVIAPRTLDDLIQIEQSKRVMARPVCSETVLREQDALRMRMQDQQAADIRDLRSAVEDGGWVAEARLTFCLLAVWTAGRRIHPRYKPDVVLHMSSEGIGSIHSSKLSFAAATVWPSTPAAERCGICDRFFCTRSRVT